jgi:hypothetical protein|tara:strand:- start:251 stop:544 length:294 start_codon:yes stop_codon:yes gene_type:complete
MSTHTTYPLTVAGVTYHVQFPHKAYDCQLTMMEKVLESLATGRNALLESPTGKSVRVPNVPNAIAHGPSITNVSRPKTTGPFSVGTIPFPNIHSFAS